MLVLRKFQAERLCWDVFAALLVRCGCGAQVAMCTPVVQGYGLSETCGSSFVALPAPVRLRMRVTNIGIRHSMPDVSLLASHVLDS